MANYHTHFCEVLKIDEEDEAWLKGRIAYFKDPPDGGLQYLAACERYKLEAGDPLQFNVDFLSARGEVYFDSDGEGDPDHVIALVQEMFAARGHRTAFFTISWAFTCDKQMPGAFGGGATLVTFDELYNCDPHQYTDDQASRHEWLNCRNGNVTGP